MKISTMVLAIMSATVLAAAEQEFRIGAPDHECTSWMIFSDLTGNNTNILHKNRDAHSRNIAVARGENAQRKWVGLGSLTPERFSMCMGLNSSGLAAVMNSGEPTPENSTALKWKGRTTPMLLEDIVKNCDTAAQAVEKLRTFIAAKDYDHMKKGSIFFFLDTREGYIVEVTTEIVSAQRFDRGYDFRANIWHNPGMVQRADSDWARYFQNVIREYALISTFNGILDRNGGRLGLADSLALSRDWNTPIDVPINRRVCFGATNSGASLVVDREFPDVLSVGYMAIGHPRHTIYVPVPVCTEKLDKRMEDLTWSKADWERFDKLGLGAPIPKEWLKFEEKSRAEFDASLAEARKLLKAGKKAEAVALVNASAAKIWNEAAKLLGL